MGSGLGVFEREIVNVYRLLHLPLLLPLLIYHPHRLQHRTLPLLLRLLQTNRKPIVRQVFKNLAQSYQVVFYLPSGLYRFSCQNRQFDHFYSPFVQHFLNLLRLLALTHYLLTCLVFVNDFFLLKIIYMVFHCYT